MARENELTQGDLTESSCHICVDMQRLFAEDTEWFTPWMERVVPNARRIVEAHAAQTIFPRFIPAQRPGEGPGSWGRYCQRRGSMTSYRLGTEVKYLVPGLASFVPPAEVL